MFFQHTGKRPAGLPTESRVLEGDTAVSKKRHNKNSHAGFVPIRRGIFEHISDGRMSGKEWMVYSTLHLKADHETGICYKISAPALGYLLGIKPHYINRLMRSLEQKGYVKRISHRGQVACYPVVINKFLTSNGILIDAHNTKSLNKIGWYVEQDCILTVLQRSFKCISNVLQTSSLQEVKNIRIKQEAKKNGGRSPATPKSFTPPAPEEVTEYATSIGFQLDGQQFIDFYEAKGWMIGKSKMRDWKAAVRTWQRRDLDGSNKKRPEFPQNSNIGETIEA